MFIIRPATPEDAAYIQQVLYAAYIKAHINKAAGITETLLRETLAGFLSNEQITRRKNSIINSPAENTYLVAEKDKEIIGVCQIAKKEMGYHLQKIYVLPDYQKSGVGRMLWMKTAELMQEGSAVTVHVASYNINAVNFYQRLGFVQIGDTFFDDRLKLVDGSNIPLITMKLFSVSPTTPKS